MAGASRLGFRRTALFACCLVLAACSDDTSASQASDSGQPDQGVDAPVADADAGDPDASDASADSAGEGGSQLDFSCLNSAFPTTVPDPVTITGQVSSDGISGIAAELEVRRAVDDSVLDSVTTGADGNYSLTVPTGGVPTAVYFRVTAPEHVETYRYFGYPLTGNTSSSQRIWRLTTLQAYAAKGGVAPTAGKGMVYLAARDCALVRVGAGVVYTTKPAPAELAYEQGADCDTPNLQATTSTDCTWATSFDVEPGVLEVDATLGSTDFLTQSVRVVTDSMTWVTLQPDRP